MLSLRSLAFRRTALYHIAVACSGDVGNLRARTEPPYPPHRRRNPHAETYFSGTRNQQQTSTNGVIVTILAPATRYFAQTFIWRAGSLGNLYLRDSLVLRMRRAIQTQRRRVLCVVWIQTNMARWIWPHIWGGLWADLP